MNASLEAVVRHSGQQQILLHRVAGGVWTVLGALLFVLSLFVAGKAGEEAMRVGAGVAGVLLIVAGVAYIRMMSGRVATLVEMLVSRPAELKEPGITALRSRGRIIAHEISVLDGANRKYRMSVPSEAVARAMLARVPR